MEIIDDFWKSKFCETKGIILNILLVVKVALVFIYGGHIFLKAIFRIG